MMAQGLKNCLSTEPSIRTLSLKQAYASSRLHMRDALSVARKKPNACAELLRLSLANAGATGRVRNE